MIHRFLCRNLGSTTTLSSIFDLLISFVARTTLLFGCVEAVKLFDPGTVLALTMVAVDVAAALEAEAQEYPDQHLAILLEAAEAWRRAGNPERADALLTELIALGGEDGCCARFPTRREPFRRRR